jgi:glycosyltransferase involved in cell wall biosynthesis
MVRLGIVSVFQNEGGSLKEWIRFHQAQGFTRFYLFDDKSTDNSREVLAPFVADGTVTLGVTSDLPKFVAGRQPEAFNIGLRQARGECDWVALIDADEFVFSPNGNIADHLPKNPLVTGVAMWWRIFGSSHHETPPPSGVLLSFTRSAKFPTTLRDATQIYELQNSFFGDRGRVISGNILQVKCILRPRMIREYHIHRPTKYWGRLIDENGKTFEPGRHVPTHAKLRINHYWSKSLGELRTKAKKFASAGTATFEDYLRWNDVLNEEEDRVILDHLDRQAHT